MICVGAAVALPILSYFALGSYYESVAVEGKIPSWDKRQRDVDSYGKQLKQYREFAGKVRAFVATAEKTGVTPDKWNTHKIVIKQRDVTFRELGRLISETSGGLSQFFIPKKLEMLAKKSAPVDGVTLSLEGEFLVKVQ